MMMHNLGESGSGSTNIGHLPPFHGRPNKNMTTWLFQIKKIFQAKRITGKQAIPFVAEGLREAALIWYQNMCAQGGPPRDLDIFTLAITHAFQPVNHQQLLRRQLRALRQTGQVQKYVYKFRNLMGQIANMDKMDKVMHFVDGLKLATQVEVNYNMPRTLEMAIEIAIRYDMA